MRTLLITNDFPPFWAGEAQYYYNLWRLLPAQDVIVLAPRIPGCAEFDRVQRFKIYRARGLLFPGFFGKFVKPFIYLFCTLKILQRHKDIKLVHCGNILATFLSGMFARRFYKIPYFVYLFAEDLRGYGKVRIFRDFFVRFLNNAKRVIIISDFTRQRFIAKGVKPEVISTVYPGVDTDNFYPADASGLREKLRLKGKKVVLSVGRLAKRKGFDMVIQAMPQVLAKVPNAALLVCGQGELSAKLKKMVQDSHLGKHVIFTGFIPHAELPQYYNLCEVFIMPSREYHQVDAEGFGIVYLEAGACGKPAIGGRSGGIPDAILEAETGFLVDPGDVEGVANAIIRILSDDNLARRLGENARRRILEKFQWKLSSRVLEDLMSAQ